MVWESWPRGPGGTTVPPNSRKALYDSFTAVIQSRTAFFPSPKYISVRASGVVRSSALAIAQGAKPRRVDISSRFADRRGNASALSCFKEFFNGSRDYAANSS